MPSDKENDKIEKIVSDNSRDYSSINNIHEYLDALFNTKDKTIIICVKDTAGYWLDENVQSKLNALGLKENLIKRLMVGYIAVLRNGNVVYESQPQQDTPVLYAAEFGNHRYKISSKPFQNGNLASVIIDGKEYAINSRGLNFVIFDEDNSKLVDSVAFDTHVKGFTCTRDIVKHYDVCLVGIWWGANYGSCLNGYAVYKVLKSLKLSVLLLNKHNAVENDWEITNTHNARFIKRFYPPEEVSPIIPLKDLKKLNENCDTFLVGSDQVWNYFINNMFDMIFSLGFVDNDKRKISFGTSFGKAEDITPKDKVPMVKSLLERFDAISVREQSGVKICKDIYGVEATQVIEPVFCLERSEYLKLAETSELKISEPYILTYILDPTPERREAILYYSEISGMKAINVLDGNPTVYDKNYKALNLPNIMGKISANDLMKLYAGASFVITDSFHGTAFSVIFNKPFLAIANQSRGATRFEELLGKFGLTERLAMDSKHIPHDKKYLEPIDYTHVNEIIKSERVRAIEWLKGAILGDKTVYTAIPKSFCTGCGACVSACPTKAIELKPDLYGSYRSVLNKDKCINCGKCKKVCPVVELPKNHNEKDPACYAFVTADEEVLFKSSSGGAFSALADIMFRKNGVVCGAAWRDDFTVEHIIIENKNDLDKLRKSKYMQSYMGDIDKQIKKLLDSGRSVLFVGCPCEVAGLRKYLGKDYDNLILVDLLCTNAPSAGLFRKYFDEAFCGTDEVFQYTFRNKKNAPDWGSKSIMVVKKDGEEIIRTGKNEDYYQAVFSSTIMSPTHCRNCKFQGLPRMGDLTIGDFWGIKNIDRSFDSSNGVSEILVNNEKGERYLREISALDTAVLKPESLAQAKKFNGYAYQQKRSWPDNPAREKFFETVLEEPFSKAVKAAQSVDIEGMKKF